MTSENIRTVCLALLVYAGVGLLSCETDGGRHKSSSSASDDIVGVMTKYADEEDASKTIALIDSLVSANAISEAAANAHRTHIYFDRQE